MTRILAIETATENCSVAVISDDGQGAEVIGSREIVARRVHSRLLMNLVDGVTDDLDLGPASIDGVAVGIGPGSYTGLRIGLATAKAIAWSQGIPCLGVMSLDAMVLGPGQIATGLAEALVCPTIASKGQQVYAALYRRQEGALRRLGGPWLIGASSLITKVSAFSEPILMVGKGSSGLLEGMKERLQGRYLAAPSRDRYPSAGAVGLIAAARARGRGYTGRGSLPEIPKDWNPFTLKPLYLRKSAAEEKRQRERTEC